MPISNGVKMVCHINTYQLFVTCRARVGALGKVVKRRLLHLTLPRLKGQHRSICSIRRL